MPSHHHAKSACATLVLFGLFILIPLLTDSGPSFKSIKKLGSGNSAITSYVVDPQKQHLQFYWKDDSGHILGNFGRLKAYFAGKHQRLVFAMNGGMFKTDYSPLGLFIQNRKMVTHLNTANPSPDQGNFYLKPNGVLFIDVDNVPGICKTQEFNNKAGIKYATQSGPMLVILGEIHPAFKVGSQNLNIRNGVGILPGNKLLFAISDEPINFYDFASYFKDHGCANALYLDGFVSKIYLPGMNLEQTDYTFGVMIAVTEPE
jgi:uncharacterized protein YigE (DUF2233 family)